MWLSRPAARWMILAAHLVFLFGILMHQGLLMDKEASKYIGCAMEVLQGDFHDLTGNYLKYGAYVLFILPFVAVGLPPLAVVAQIVLGILAASALGRFVQRWTGSKATGMIAMSIFLLCYPIQVWTLALYTESFFMSVSILFVERITRTQRLDAGSMALAALVLFARPVGMLIVGPGLLWKMTEGLPTTYRKSLRWAGYATVLVVAIYLPGLKPAQMAPIVEAHVIAGIPEDPGAMEHFAGTSIVEAQGFLLQRHGLIAWIELAGRRMASLFTLHRPYYSLGHNWIMAVHYLLYPLAILGWWRGPKDPASQLIATTLLLYTLLIGLTHDEWSGRFLVPMMPWIIGSASHVLGRSHRISAS